jgi:hypothetical protein
MYIHMYVCVCVYTRTYKPYVRLYVFMYVRMCMYAHIIIIIIIIIIINIIIIFKKVMQSRYKPGVAQRVPGS